MTESIVYKNVLAWRGCEKLYLDLRTCDVYFLFKSKTVGYEKVPAHRNILATVSPVFDAMFYGPHKQSGNINIINSTTTAFQEFLQFFYLSTVTLTADNVPEVMYLGKEYLLTDCLNACTTFCESTLTMDNICWGYELAILFEDDGLKRFCERKISENPSEIFKSDSFLACESNVLRHILQLNSFKCDESIVFDGCMAWARATCIQKGLNEKNNKNLRTELGDLFDEIQFGRMKIDHFYTRHMSHDGLFTEPEFKEIVGKIAFKVFRPRAFSRHLENDDENDLICNRMGSNHSDENLYKFQTHEIHENMCIDKTVFKSNSKLLLKRLICKVDFCRDNKSGIHSTKATIRINESPDDHCNGNLVAFTEAILNNMDKIEIDLSSAVVVKAGVKYEIEIEMEIGITYSSEKCLKQVRMEHGIIVDFLDGKH